MFAWADGLLFKGKKCPLEFSRLFCSFFVFFGAGGEVGGCCPSLVSDRLLPFWEEGRGFIAGRNRNANKGARRSVLVLSGVVFLLRRLVEHTHTRTDAAATLRQGRTLSLSQQWPLCSLRELEAANSEQDQDEEDSGKVSQMRSTQRHSELLHF